LINPFSCFGPQGCEYSTCTTLVQDYGERLLHINDLNKLKKTECQSFCQVLRIKRLKKSFLVCKLDGFVKSPTSALRCIPRHYDVLSVRLIPRNLRALNLELFTLPSKSDFFEAIKLNNLDTNIGEQILFIDEFVKSRIHHVLIP